MSAEYAGNSSESIVERVMREQAGARTLVSRHAGMVEVGPELLPRHGADGIRSERLRALRTDLLLLTGEHRHCTQLALLSPGSGEGRSRLAAELALVFSQLGRHTLLVDADLRRPTQHCLFNAPNDFGLARALVLEEAPKLYGVEGFPFLSVLPAGHASPNPLELLSGRRFEPLMRRLRQHYDFIVLDTPPVDLYADGLTVAAQAGNVLVLSRLAATSQRHLRHLIGRVAIAQARILGAVVSRF